MNELPKTFQDAIHVTRALGFQYLWIDSLCIVQDDAEDWAAESRRMEHVFSSAYVTIAASCASGTGDGFLQSRMPRKFVPVTRPNGVQYAFCETIDNFDLDVEKGELNKRGWVLQERALSRRTIFFTKTQTYWECGGAVRCETLTKMKKYTCPSSSHRDGAIADFFTVEKRRFSAMLIFHSPLSSTLKG